MRSEGLRLRTAPPSTTLMDMRGHSEVLWSERPRLLKLRFHAEPATGRGTFDKLKPDSGRSCAASSPGCQVKALRYSLEHSMAGRSSVTVKSGLTGAIPELQLRNICGDRQNFTCARRRADRQAGRFGTRDPVSPCSVWRSRRITVNRVEVVSGRLRRYRPFNQRREARRRELDVGSLA